MGSTSYLIGRSPLGAAPAGLREIPCDGGPLVWDTSDLVGRRFLLRRSFGPEVVDVLDWIIDWIGPGAVWDIGANKDQRVRRRAYRH
jgi:hypothetical protein